MRLCRFLLPVLAIAVAGVGCGAAASTATPGATLDSFAQAIRRGRYEQAYRFMSEAYRRQVDKATFVREMRANPEEARQLAEKIAGSHDRVTITAQVPYDDRPLHLVKDGKAWHLTGNVVDFYDQSTPRAALRSFVRAMERQRYDVVLRFVPDADRQGMTVEQMRKAWQGKGREEVERLLANLRANMDNPIEVVGDRATMPYGERFSVQFVREDGVWKIEDPD